ncbi:MAG: aminopeptidase [Candidatus Diapherotrites archaeon]|nr:aminopeptidase [Candidatus Diapherotrites archaeon]
MNGAENAVKKSLAVKAGEEVLIITDEKKTRIAGLLADECIKIGAKVTTIFLQKTQRPMTEIPKCIKNAAIACDVAMTPFSAFHEEGTFRFKLIKLLVKNNARVAHMPNIPLSTIESGALGVDFKELNKISEKINKKLKNVDEITIISGKNKNLTFSIKNSKMLIDDGNLTQPGSWGNLPAGESFLVPVPKTGNGEFECNVTAGGIGKIMTPITLVFEKGKIVKINGKGTQADKIRNAIENATGDKDILCEFGIGTNPFAKQCGNTLVDEKLINTCHIAIGENTGFGGTNKSSIHIDFVTNNPKFFSEDKEIELDLENLTTK